MDFLIFHKINGLAGEFRWLDFFGIFTAKYLGYLLVGYLLFLVVRDFRKYWPMVWRSLAAAVFARFVVAEIIRWLWARPRPFDLVQGKPFANYDVNLLIDHVNSASFPSGHATFYFALSAAVYLFNKKTGLLFFAASFFIAISRVFVGVHWPSDILAGAVIGGLCGWLILKKTIKPKNFVVD